MDVDTFSAMLSGKYHIRRHLNERALCLCAAADAKACNLSRNTIYAGIRDMEGEKQHQLDTTEHYRIRKSGGGRKQLPKNNPQILMALNQMVDPVLDKRRYHESFAVDM